METMNDAKESSGMVRGGLSAEIVERMQKDQFLPEDFPEVRAPRSSEGTVVVLTGATGFLGATLLVELLAHPHVEVRCLVRSKTPDEGLARIHETLRRYGLPVGELSRVAVFTGNLELPRFGLSTRDFQALGEGVTCVLHCAAAMLWTRSYEKLRAANVLGCLEALRLAAEVGARFDYVSSLGVHFTPSDPKAVIADGAEAAPQRQATGYQQTKWVAERLVLATRSRGLRANIYRPGYIGPSRASGAPSRDDFWTMMLAAIQRMQLAPMLDARYDVVPVDDLARLLVSLLRTGEDVGVMHLNHPCPPPFASLLHSAREEGRLIEQVPFESWTAHVEAMARKGYPFSGLSILLRRPKGWLEPGTILEYALQGARLRFESDRGWAAMRRHQVLAA